MEETGGAGEAEEAGDRNRPSGAWDPISPTILSEGSGQSATGDPVCRQP